MAVIQPPKTTSIKGAFDKLATTGSIGDTTYILWRDGSYNTVIKARANFQKENTAYQFDVTVRDQSDRTLITRLR